jgi:hypothetical protein
MEHESKPQSEQEKQAKKRLTFIKSLNIAVEFGFIIVLPLLGFGYLGKYLDNRYGKEFFVLIGILLALAASGIWFYKRINELLKDLKDQ